MLESLWPRMTAILRGVHAFGAWPGASRSGFSLDPLRRGGLLKRGKGPLPGAPLPSLACLVEAAGIEPASASSPPVDLHV